MTDSLLAPFILFFSTLLGQFFTATGSYGLSLILLSAVTFLVTWPLLALTDKLRKKTLKKQSELAPELEKLKDVDNPQKRYFYTKRIYRIYKYHPAHSLKGLLGLAVQIPFFIAAYKFLGNCRALDGLSFLFIKDLSKPDGLLAVNGHIINVLPFIMTAVNLIGVYFHNRTKSFNERLQGTGIALIFFFLLYDQPAALLVYWTMNNILASARILYLSLRHKGTECVASVTDSIREKEISVMLSTLLGFYLGIYLIFNIFLSWKSYVIIPPAAVLSGIALLFYFYLLWILKKLFRKAVYFYTAALLMIYLGILTVLSNLDSLFSFVILLQRQPIISIVVIFILFTNTLNVLLLLRNKQECQCMPSGAGNNNRNHFILAGASLFFLGFTLFFAIPESIYLTSPYEFASDFLPVLKGNIIPFVLFLAAGLIICTVDFIRYKSLRMTAIALFAVIIFVLLNSLVFSRNFGRMTSFVFSRPVAPTILRNGFELAVAAAALLLSRYIVSCKVKSAVYFVLIISAVPLIQFLYKLPAGRKANVNSLEYKVHFNPEAGNRKKDTAFQHWQQHYSPLLTFSRHGKNVIFLILDMFPGSFIAPLFKKYPEFQKEYSGFTWYPNTLSITNLTYYTVPVFNAGMAFTPENLNKDKGTLEEKTTRSYEKLFSALQKNRYQVSCVTHEGYQPALVPILRKYHINGVANGYFMKGTLQNAQAIMQDIATAYSSILSHISLMIMTPSLLNRYIYQNGDWLIMEKQRKTNLLNNLVSLLALARYCSVADTGNTYKRFHNGLAHEPYQLDADGKLATPDPSLTPKQQYEKNAFTTLKVNLEILAQWIQWLKNNKIYDNTMIILISDHSNEKHDIRLDIAKGKPFPIPVEKLNRLHPLLMVKPFNSHGSFKVDWRFMSSGDASAIVASALEHPEDLTNDKNPLDSLPPSHRTLPAFWLEDVDYHSMKPFKYEKYLVRDFFFRPDAWQKAARQAEKKQKAVLY